MKPTALWLALAAAALTPAAAQQTRPFRHLDVSISAGSPGIGLDLGTDLTPWLKVRAGVTYMPHFKPRMDFEIGLFDTDGTPLHNQFGALSERLEQITGYQVDESIGMIGEPRMNQFRLMADFFPIPRNRHWHVTAGFFVGKRRIASAYNTTEDMPSLVGVGIYNRMYERASNGEPIYKNYYYPELADYGRMAIHMGDYTRDVYTTYAQDVVCDLDYTYPKTDAEGNVLMDEWGFPEYYEEGEVMHAAGETALAHKAGDPYMMTPDENSMVRARMLVNAFRPYLGIGYEGRLLRADDRFHIGFDAGILMWGGTPKVITHDGTDLTHDVTNVPGKVGDYVNLVKHFKVMPVLSLRLTRRF